MVQNDVIHPVTACIDIIPYTHEKNTLFNKKPKIAKKPTRNNIPMSKKPKRTIRYAVEKIPLHQRTTKAYSKKIRRPKAWANRRKISAVQENRRATANVKKATTSETTLKSGIHTKKNSNLSAGHMGERVRSELKNSNNQNHDLATDSSDNEPANSDGQSPTKLNLHQPANRPYLIPSRNISIPSTAAHHKSSVAKLPAMLAREVLSRCEEYDNARIGKISIAIFRCRSYLLGLSLIE